jgi:hypothetical protein
MQGEGLLLGLSQLALGLAGFAGIVGAFRRSNNEWVPQDFMGLRIILELTLASSICALLPLALYLAYRDEPLAIRWSSLVLSVFFIVHLIIELRRAASFRRRGFPPRHPLLHVLVLLIPQFAFFLLSIANFLWMRSEFFYVSMLIFLLFAASIQFFALANPLDEDFFKAGGTSVPTFEKETAVKKKRGVAGNRNGDPLKEVP